AGLVNFGPAMVRVVGFQANTATKARVNTRVAIGRVLVFMAQLLRCPMGEGSLSQSANQLTHRPHRATARELRMSCSGRTFAAAAESSNRSPRTAQPPRYGQLSSDNPTEAETSPVRPV